MGGRCVWYIIQDIFIFSTKRRKITSCYYVSKSYSTNTWTLIPNSVLNISIHYWFANMLSIFDQLFFWKNVHSTTKNKKTFSRKNNFSCTKYTLHHYFSTSGQVYTHSFTSLINGVCSTIQTSEFRI